MPCHPDRVRRNYQDTPTAAPIVKCQVCGWPACPSVTTWIEAFCRSCYIAEKCNVNALAGAMSPVGATFESNGIEYVVGKELPVK